jgi:hypothetical protein
VVGVIDLNALASGGIGSIIVGGLWFLVKLIFEKKLRTPSDTRADAEFIVKERQELIQSYRDALGDANMLLQRVQKGLEDANTKLTEANEKADELQDRMKDMEREWLGWGRAAANVIRRLGTDEDIPRPAPSGLQIS